MKYDDKNVTPGDEKFGNSTNEVSFKVHMHSPKIAAIAKLFRYQRERIRPHNFSEINYVHVSNGNMLPLKYMNYPIHITLWWIKWIVFNRLFLFQVVAVVLESLQYRTVARVIRRHRITCTHNAHTCMNWYLSRTVVSWLSQLLALL